LKTDLEDEEEDNESRRGSISDSQQKQFRKALNDAFKKRETLISSYTKKASKEGEENDDWTVDLQVYLIFI
jgi:hypothetical protein